MRSLKKMSTHCLECGVEWLPDLSNKKAARALCISCFEGTAKQYANKNLIPKDEYRKVKYEEFKIENRSEYYSALLVETKGMDRITHREWLTNKLNEIMQNQKLWEYISTQKPAVKKKYHQKKLNSSKNLLENF